MKIFILFFSFFLLNHLAFNTSALKAIDVEKSITIISSGGANSVGCNDQYCGVIISPRVDTKKYSFTITSTLNSKLYDIGEYNLKFKTDLIHTYTSKIIEIISPGFSRTIDITNSGFYFQRYIYSDKPFYLKITYTIDSISYVNGNVDVDLFKDFSFYSISNKEQTTLEKNTSGSLWVVDDKNITISPSNNSYSFFIKNKNHASNLFQKGKYFFSFYFKLSSCSEFCSDFQYQKIIINSNQNQEVLHVSYINEGVFNIEFEVNQDFFITIENKVLHTRNDDFPIDYFSNFFIQNKSKKDTFISLSESGSLYNVNQDQNNISISPSQDLKYRFVLTKNSNMERFSPGIYRLKFNYNLDSYDANIETPFSYQKVTVVSFDQSLTFSLNYLHEEIEILEFSSLTPFYIEFENSIFSLNQTSFPIDSFSNFDLEKTDEITDINPPFFQEDIGVIVTEIDSPITINQIKSMLSAFDDVDGNVSDNIFVKEDNYSNNISIIGEYTIIFSVFDNSFNFTDIEIRVHLKDFTPPLVVVNNNVNCYISSGCFLNQEQFSIDDLDKIVIVSDNYDTEANIEIVYDNFSTNEEKRTDTTYTIEFFAIDSSFNKSNHYFLDFIYIDDIAPVILSGLKFEKGLNYSVDLTYILNQVKISNNFNNTKEIQTKNLNQVGEILEDNYSQNMFNIGEFEIVFKVENKTFNLVVEILDDIPPLFQFSDKIINIEDFSLLSDEEVINLDISLGLIEQTFNYINIKETIIENNIKRIINEYNNHYQIKEEIELKIKQI